MLNFIESEQIRWTICNDYVTSVSFGDFLWLHLKGRKERRHQHWQSLAVSFTFLWLENVQGSCNRFFNFFCSLSPCQCLTMKEMTQHRGLVGDLSAHLFQRDRRSRYNWWKDQRNYDGTLLFVQAHQTKAKCILCWLFLVLGLPLYGFCAPRLKYYFGVYKNFWLKFWKCIFSI